MKFEITLNMVLSYYMVLFALWECGRLLLNHILEMKRRFQAKEKNRKARVLLAQAMLAVILAFAPPVYYGYHALHDSHSSSEAEHA